MHMHTHLICQMWGSIVEGEAAESMKSNIGASRFAQTIRLSGGDELQGDSQHMFNVYKCLKIVHNPDVVPANCAFHMCFLFVGQESHTVNKYRAQTYLQD